MSSLTAPQSGSPSPTVRTYRAAQHKLASAGIVEKQHDAVTAAFHAKQEFEAVLLLVVLEATIGGDRPL